MWCSVRCTRGRRLAAGLLLAACGEPTGPLPPVTLEVTASDTIQVTGGTLTFTAVARDSAGAVVPDVPVQWSVTDPGRGQITAEGLFTAGPGAGGLLVRATVAAVGLAESVAVRVVLPGTVKWTWAAAEVGGRMSWKGGPALAGDGTVLVLVTNDREPDWPATLVALAPTGVPQWTTPLVDVADNNGMSVVPESEQIWIAGQRLYLIAPTGAVLWDTIRAVDPDPEVAPIFIMGAASSEMLVAAWGKHVIAYDAADHAFRWVSQLAPLVDWLVPPTITADGHVLAKRSEDTLFLFRGADGQILRTFQDPDTGVDKRVFGRGTVPVGSRYYLPTWARLAAYDTSGTLLWLTAPNGTTEPVVGADGTLYVQTNGRGLQALNPDGSVRWERQTPFENRGPREGPKWPLWHGGPALAEGGILYLAGRGAFMAYDVNGTLLWQHQADSAGTAQAFLGSPAIAPDGTVYTWTETHVYAFWASAPPDPNSPWPMWRHDAQRTGWVTR
jgi:outer membrane protein assembly factor BamB